MPKSKDFHEKGTGLNGAAEGSGAAYYVADGILLEYWALLPTGNLREAIKGLFESGKIRIPVQVWKEFAEAFADEAEEIADMYQNHKIRREYKYILAAGRVAEELSLGIDPRGNADLYAAGVAVADSMAIATNMASAPAAYRKLPCAVVDVGQLLP